jgi:hypothetical protein
MVASNATYLRIILVESVKSVSALCAVPKRESSKMLGGAICVSKNKLLQANS